MPAHATKQLSLAILSLGLVGLGAFVFVGQRPPPLPTAPQFPFAAQITDGSSKKILPKDAEEGIVIPPSTNVIVQCGGNGTFPLMVPSVSRDDAIRFWVYEYTGKEPPFTGAFAFSLGEYQSVNDKTRKAYDHLLKTNGALNAFTRGRQYYVMTNKAIGFRCGEGLGAASKASEASEAAKASDDTAAEDTETNNTISDDTTTPEESSQASEGSEISEASEATKEPTTIATCEELQKMSEDLSAHYILIKDIDCSETENWNEGKGFEPIGFRNGVSDQPFTGQFDGHNHTIFHLTIKRPNQSFVGLFSQTENATLEHIELRSPVIEGNIHVGALVGSFHADNSSSYISNIAVTGTEASVTGKIRVGALMGSAWGQATDVLSGIDVTGDRWVGGIAGTLFTGRLERAYSSGDITATAEYAGGLLGSAERQHDWLPKPIVGYAFATGTVSAPSKVGALIGDIDNADLLHLYWPYLSSDLDNCYDGGREGCTALDAKTDVFYNAQSLPLTQWDFDAVWQVVDSGLPLLQWQEQVLTKAPVAIETCQDFQEIRNDLSANFIQMNDIDCSISASWSDGSGFMPLGSDDTPFSGSFDGQGFSISHLSIKRPDRSGVSPFGVVDGAEIFDTTLTNVSIVGGAHTAGLVSTVKNSTLNTVAINGGTIEGADIVGGVAAENHSSIEHASVVLERLVGKGTVGGLVGFNTDLIASSRVTADIEGDSSVGGFIGINTGIVELSDVSGSVQGKVSIGGFVGDNSGDINNCFSQASATGDENVGGFVGTHRGNIDNVYTTGDVTASAENVGGIAGALGKGNVRNAFSVSALDTSEQATFVGALFGTVDTDAIVVNAYWNDTNHNPSHCFTQSDQTPANTNCTPISGIANQSHFFDSTNEPLVSWNADLWVFHKNLTFPTFDDNVDAECSDRAACDDGIECTIDICTKEGGCSHDFTACECNFDADCDDGRECSVDTCLDIFSCVHDTSACPIALCGDGVIAPEEECDIGDSDAPFNALGCSSCRVQPGFTCEGEPSVCTLLIPVLP